MPKYIKVGCKIPTDKFHYSFYSVTKNTAVVYVFLPYGIFYLNLILVAEFVVRVNLNYYYSPSLTAYLQLLHFHGQVEYLFRAQNINVNGVA